MSLIDMVASLSRRDLQLRLARLDHQRRSDRYQKLFQALRRRIQQGATTGDQLLDLVIAQQGTLEPSALEPLKKLAQLIAVHAGQLLLVTVFESSLADPGTAFTESSVDDVGYRWSLGRLTGQRLAVSRPSDREEGGWSCVFPSPGYVTCSVCGDSLGKMYRCSPICKQAGPWFFIPPAKLTQAGDHDLSFTHPSGCQITRVTAGDQWVTEALFPPPFNGLPRDLLAQMVALLS